MFTRATSCTPRMPRSAAVHAPHVLLSPNPTSPTVPPPQLVASLIASKEKGETAAWLAFQTQVSSLKLQRSRLAGELEAAARAMAAAERRERSAAAASTSALVRDFVHACLAWVHGCRACLSVCLSVCLCYSVALEWTLAAFPMNFLTMQRPEYLETPNQH
jgi:hypothetical protein